MDDLKGRLNPAQFEAVSTIEGPVLVVAGAGSGKTRVIEYRVLNMVQKGIRPDSILLLTFTRKAAREMLSRAARHDPRCEYVAGGTFHSFGLNMLRRYGSKIGLNPRFIVLDEADAEESIQRCARMLGIFDQIPSTPKKTTLRNIISMAINRKKPIDAILEKEYPHFGDLSSEIERLMRQYIEYKREKAYLDYDDLLIFLKKVLENDDLRERITDRFHYIMIDEYQDTNLLQRDIAYLLGDVHQNIMVVGDDAQSIYGFRGASFENIFDFPKHYANCRVIKLEENYRSTQPILNLANQVLEYMANKYSKCLQAVKGRSSFEPEVFEFMSLKDEAEYLADKIIEMKTEGIPLDRQGVLFRSSFVSIPLQAELSKRRIPYQVFGGLRFYETAHVKDVVAHLKIIANHKDELAWNRVLLLIDGIGPAYADHLSYAFTQCGDRESIVEEMNSRIELSPRYQFGLARLRALLDRIGNSLSVSDSFRSILEYYYTIFRKKYDDWHYRQRDLETLREMVENYDDLDELLGDLAVDPPERGMRFDYDIEDESPVTLSTIHSAKGLEWDAVFFIGLLDGVIPSSFTFDCYEDIEEERRLFYVAITRAKDYLFLSLNYEGYRIGRNHFCQPSRFMRECNLL